MLPVRLALTSFDHPTCTAPGLQTSSRAIDALMPGEGFPKDAAGGRGPSAGCVHYGGVGPCVVGREKGSAPSAYSLPLATGV